MAAQWSDCLTKRTRSNPKLPSHFVKITKPRHFVLLIPNPKTGFMYHLSYIITYHSNIHFRTFSNMIWSSNHCSFALPTSTPYGSPRSAPGSRSPRSPRRRTRPRCPRAPGGWNSTRAWPSPPAAGQRLGMDWGWEKSAGMEKHLDEHYVILYIIYIMINLSTMTGSDLDVLLENALSVKVIQASPKSTTQITNFAIT